MAPNIGQPKSVTSTSAIASFFYKKTIFITGATGFVGKCLIEKLFRSCPDIEQIHILVRRKHNSSPNERLTELCSSPLFDTLRSINPKFISKLSTMEGDLNLPNFGLNKADETILINKCHIVFHCAATIRFNEPLKTALQINVGSVQKLFQLCSKMTYVQSIVHVSTAYANCDRTHIDEVVYYSSSIPDQLLAATEWMDESLFDLITPQLIRNLPNTYTFTKGLAESYLNTYAQHLPIAIIRPSIIGPTWQEPVPGFTDNYTGPTGIIVALASGFSRAILADPNIEPNVVPADTVVNTMIALAWYRATQAHITPLQKKSHMLPVVHCCAAGRRTNNKCLTSQQWVDTISDQLTSNKIAFERCIRWPELVLNRNKFVYTIRHYLQEVLIVHILDLVLWLTQKKPMFVRLLNRTKKSFQVLHFFLNNNWTFASENNEALYDIMCKNDIDRQLFNFDLSELNWTEYVRNHIMGVKRYLLKEDLNRMTKCYKRNLKLKLIQRLISFGIMIVIFISIFYVHIGVFS